MPESNAHDTVTFIFQGFRPCSGEIKFEDGTIMQVIIPDLLFKDEERSLTLHPAVGLVGDTISVPTSSDLILFTHKINMIDSFEYLFKKGDTILFSYLDGYPVATVLNRKTAPEELNWELQFGRRSLGSGQYSMASKYFYPEVVSNTINGIDEKRYRKEFLSLYMTELITEGELLDSLLSKKLLSEATYVHFKDRVKYDSLCLALNNNRLDTITISGIISDYGRLAHHPYSNFTKFLNVVVIKFFVNESKLIKTGSGFVRDYRTSFENIQRSRLFPKKMKDQVLYQQLKQIAEKFSLNDFNRYFEKFKAQAPDSLLLDSIRQTYLLEFQVMRAMSEGVQVIGLDKRKGTLADIVKLNRGKLIYVDFWASWCGPCRDAMPASKLLREEYAEKVVFIFLSSDRDFDKWKRASRDEGIEFYVNNYLIMNLSKSDFLTALKFREIPRYILFDSEGNLVHRNAPGPGSDEVRNLLDKYL